MNNDEIFELKKLKIFNDVFDTDYSLAEFYAHHTEKDLDSCWNIYNNTRTSESIEYLISNGCKHLECLRCPLNASSKFCKVLFGIAGNKNKRH